MSLTQAQIELLALRKELGDKLSYDEERNLQYGKGPENCPSHNHPGRVSKFQVRHQVSVLREKEEGEG